MQGNEANNIGDATVNRKTPLCPIHQMLDDSGTLECEIGGNNCVACSLNERAELLALLAPFAAKDGSEDTLTVLRRLTDFYGTHQGEGRVVVSYPASAPTLHPAEVVSCAQAVLTALNVGDVEKDSPLHLKLREVMIAHRAQASKPVSV